MPVRRVGVKPGCEDEYLDIHAGGQHARQRLETDVEHGASPPMTQSGLFCQPIWSQRSRTPCVGGRVFEQGVGPRTR